MALKKPDFPLGNKAFELNDAARKVIKKGEEIKGEQRWKRMKVAAGLLRQQRAIGWVSDVSNWSAFIDYMYGKILDENANDNEGKERGYGMTLINVAFTWHKGKKFYYFDAVDRGRKAVRPRYGKTIVFLMSPDTPQVDANGRARNKPVNAEPNLYFSKGANAAKPAYITLRAKQRIDSRFNSDIIADLRTFIEELGDDFAKQFNTKATSLPNLAYSGLKRSDKPGYKKRSRKAEKERKIRFNSPEEVAKRKAEAAARAKLLNDPKVRKELARSRKENRRTVGPAFTPDDTANAAYIAPKKGINKGLLSSRQAKEGGATQNVVRPVLVEKVFRILPDIPMHFDSYITDLSDDSYDQFTEEEADSTIQELLDQLDAEQRIEYAQLAKSMQQNQKKHLITDAHADRKKAITDLKLLNRNIARQMQKILGTPVYFGRAQNSGFIVEGKFLDVEGEKLTPERRAAEQELINNYNNAKKNIWLAMLKLGSPEEIMKILTRAVNKQIEYFQEVTPVRKGYKLLANGEALPPSDGSADYLKNSYHLVTNKQMTDRIKER